MFGQAGADSQSGFLLTIAFAVGDQLSASLQCTGFYHAEPSKRSGLVGC